MTRKDVLFQRIHSGYLDLTDIMCKMIMIRNALGACCVLGPALEKTPVRNPTINAGKLDLSTVPQKLSDSLSESLLPIQIPAPANFLVVSLGRSCNLSCLSFFICEMGLLVDLTLIELYCED